MSTTTLTFSNTVASLSGGSNAIAGVGNQYKISVSGTWSNGDEQALVFTDSETGIQTQVGAGNVTGTTPTFAFTFNQKVYSLSGQTMYFSSIGEPSTFNDPNAAGNGFITISDYYASNENVVSAAPYQGKLALISRRNVQIWQVDPDPDNYSLVQYLANIGTVAPLSVQPVGDMDIYMLADNGVRSVRVRDASNNAIVADIGTPIDSLIQSVLVGLTDAQKANSVGIVEPSSNRYMLFVPNTSDPDNSVGKIYVFSYFPSGQIAAWTTYSPTYYNSGNVAFTPEKFLVYNGQVWARGKSENNFYQLGGSNNNTYDNCGVTIVTPYVDENSPATKKSFDSIDAAFQGTWTVSASADYTTQSYKEVYSNTVSSWLRQRIGWPARGTHYSLKMVESSSSYALFSSAAVHVNSQNEK